MQSVGSFSYISHVQSPDHLVWESDLMWCCCVTGSVRLNTGVNTRRSAIWWSNVSNQQTELAMPLWSNIESHLIYPAWLVEFNAPLDTVQVISEAVFTANHYLSCPAAESRPAGYVLLLFLIFIFIFKCFLSYQLSQKSTGCRWSVWNLVFRSLRGRCHGNLICWF